MVIKRKKQVFMKSLILMYKHILKLKMELLIWIIYQQIIMVEISVILHYLSINIEFNRLKEKTMRSID